MRKLRFTYRSVPAALFVLCLVSYGLMIPWLGFYWDDWPYIWLYHQFGPSGFPAFVASDRPFSAWVFMLTTRLFGESPLGYHLLALVLRWAGAAAFWWTLRQIWPRFERQAAWAAALFAVYPAFGQQPIALIYNHHFSVMALFIASIGGMVWSVRQQPISPRRYWVGTGLSLIGAASMFSLEYFFALEALRPLILWLVLGERIANRRERLKAVLIHWAPYLAVLVLFLVWRVLIYRFPTYQPGLFNRGEGFFAVLGGLIVTILSDMFKAGVLAWSHAFPQGYEGISGRAMLAAYAALFAAATLLAAVYLLRLNGHNDPQEAQPEGTNRRWGLQAIAGGLAALLLAGWPAWITELPVTLDYPFDRLTLAFIPGACLLLVGLLELIPLNRVAKALLVAALLGGSAAWHLQNANTYRWDFQMMKSMVWQLAWRAPGLKSGTALLTNDLPFQYYSDNSTTSVINWTYAPEHVGEQMPYVLDMISVRLGSGLTGLEPGDRIFQDYRSLHFEGSTDQSISVYYQPPACLRILDLRLDDSFHAMPDLLKRSVVVSNLGQIITETNSPARPPEAIFGAEPAHNWCYYFQQADLARQRGDYEAIAAMSSEALGLGDRANESSEYLPFVEGYAHTGQWQAALDLSRRAMDEGSLVRPMLCNTWKRIGEATEPTGEQAAALEGAQQEFECETD